MTSAPDPVALAERILGLLEDGTFVATYKYAVLLGLLDLCLEKTAKGGAPPSMITTRELALKVTELYWRQCRPFSDETALRQSSGKQARIVAEIEKFRVTNPLGPLVAFAAARGHGTKFEQLIDAVEWTLIKMPLPKLQRVGGAFRPILYSIGWDDGVAHSVVRQYQRRVPGSQFDNSIRLLVGVGEGLVALNSLLRPLLHRHWAAMVASLNELEEARLEGFLFGRDRIDLGPIRADLIELQDGRCFYCADRLRSGVEVDHFIPWSRYPDDGVFNLVAADRACNSAKRDFLASSNHVRAWHHRTLANDSALRDIATRHAWGGDRDRTLGVARSIYLRLPGDIQLWQAKDRFVLERQADFAPILA